MNTHSIPAERLQKIRALAESKRCGRRIDFHEVNTAQALATKPQARVRHVFIDYRAANAHLFSVILDYKTAAIINRRLEGTGYGMARVGGY